jgi:hypothetical protein
MKSQIVRVRNVRFPGWHCVALFVFANGDEATKNLRVMNGIVSASAGERETKDVITYMDAKPNLDILHVHTRHPHMHAWTRIHLLRDVQARVLALA